MDGIESFNRHHRSFSARQPSKVLLATDWEGVGGADTRCLYAGAGFFNHGLNGFLVLAGRIPEDDFTRSSPIRVIRVIRTIRV
jgi:hypothetical protein